MTVLGPCMSVSETHYTLIARDSRILAKGACCVIRHKVRILKAPTYSLEHSFKRPEITFRELKSLMLVARGDKDKLEGLFIGMKELLGDKGVVPSSIR